MTAVSPKQVDEVFDLALSEYLASPEVVLDHLAEHRAWIKAAYDAGIMLVSGRQDPPDGGVLVFRAGSRTEAEAFAESDDAPPSASGPGRVARWCRDTDR